MSVTDMNVQDHYNVCIDGGLAYFIDNEYHAHMHTCLTVLHVGDVCIIYKADYELRNMTC